MAYLTAAQINPTMTLKRSTHNPIVKDMSKSQSEPPTFAMLKDAGDGLAEQPPVVDAKLKDDENPMKPLSIRSARDFEYMSQDMNRLFDGKETEQNWDQRRKAIIKMSRITHGNAPVDYRVQYTSFIKSQLDAILKAVDSLRTNLSTVGLNLLQHVADHLGHSVDFMIDFIADTLITRSCNTAKVKRDAAIATFETIISNATCNKNLLHHVMVASEHKDPNARAAVSSWLSALLTTNGRHCDQPGVLDLIEKCIKNGLNDAKPQVRTPMRSTYGLYAKLWPDRGERLRGSLDSKTQKMLESNSTVEPTKSALKRPSIKDIKAARKRELDAQEISPPLVAQSKHPSMKDIKAAKKKEIEAKDVRPLSAQSNRPSVKDFKDYKKRDAEKENGVRPASAQSNRSLVRDIKKAKKAHAEAEDSIHLPSAASTTSTKEGHDIARPTSGHMQLSMTERRFHILSSAPMRPQRAFGDVKRVAPKPSRSLQQQTEPEISTPRPLDDHRPSKQTEKKVPSTKNETAPVPKGDVSPLDVATARLVQLDIGENEPRPGIHNIASPPIMEVEMDKPLPSPKPLTSDTSEVTAVEKQVEKQVESHVDVTNDVAVPVKHDKSPRERPIEIHEDEVPADQEDHGNASVAIHEDKVSADHKDRGKTPRVTKRRSGERMAISKDQTKMHVRRRSATPPSPPTVLREIDQLNETVVPFKRQENTRQKYISTEAAERNRSVSPHSKNPDKARKQLSRAIEKIRARTMDDYGYRRLQGLIKIHDTLFQDETKYDELLLALLDALETPNTEKRMPLSRQHDHKFQILVTIRLMLVHNAKYCAAYYPRALSAVITARTNFESRCHIVGGLEETAEDIVAACSPFDVIDPVLDVLELQEYDEAGYRAISMGLQILSGLVAQIKGSEISDKTQEERLTRFALKCLRNENSETRRATIAFCVELRRLINPEERYFQLVAANDEALKSLLTYFIATNRRR